jgi:hypothetical protein
VVESHNGIAEMDEASTSQGRSRLPSAGPRGQSDPLALSFGDPLDTRRRLSLGAESSSPQSPPSFPAATLLL